MFLTLNHTMSSNKLQPNNTYFGVGYNFRRLSGCTKTSLEEGKTIHKV